MQSVATASLPGATAPLKGAGAVVGAHAGNLEAASAAVVVVATEAGGAGSLFDLKIDKASSDMYFHYYGMLMHQQNMLQVGSCETLWCAEVKKVAGHELQD